MKTIQSNSAKKANMLSAQKPNRTTTTPSNEKQRIQKETSAGKKLVQALLPFKTLPTKPQNDASAPSEIEVPSKKRKLSFSEESENPKKIGKSQSKENLTNIEKTDPDSSTVDIIVLEDDESDKETLPNKPKSPKTPASSKRISKKNNKTPSNSGDNANSTTPKLQIKLPLSGKKKRKTELANQSLNKTLEGGDSSDIEILNDEPKENPQKKLKLDDLSKQEDEDDVKNLEQTPRTKKNFTNSTNAESSPKLKVTSSIKTSLRGNEEEEKQSDEESKPEPKTPKTSKPSKSNSNNKGSPQEKSPETETRPNGNHKEYSLTTKKSKTPQKLDSPPKQIEEKNKVEQKESSNKNNSNASKENSPKETETPVKKDNASPTDDIIISPRTENKKESEAASSDPEFVSETGVGADTSFSKGCSDKLLTPKQQKLMEQRKKAREEKELKLKQIKEERERKLQEQREERERKLKEEKIQKQKEREERELQRKKEREEKEEQKRREREEKEDQRRKEKEDKERKRLAEIEAKNEEKRKKDEAKEEERRKKDEDRRIKELEKEEEENKKKKAAQAFVKYFVPKPIKPLTVEDQESRDDAESVDSLAFRPFQVKGDMKLAPLIRREFKQRSREKLDSFLKDSKTDKSDLYIAQLKSGAYTPLRGYKTVIKTNDDEDDVILITSELENAAQAIDEHSTKPVQKYKAKYYFFRENRRPPFYGTWRKKSTVITPRRPFATDKAFFEYDVDSDEEWEEEEPGESLNGSEDEKDESEEDEYEVDNECFVPHGHLSDEELQNEDEIGPDTSREAQLAKLKILQQQFAQEMKKKTEKIKPRLIGAIWEDENGNRPKLCPPVIWDCLSALGMIFSEPPIVEPPESTEPEPTSPPQEKQKRIEIKEDLLKDLVRLVHGNRHSRVFLIKEYMEHVSNTCDAVKNGEYLPPIKSQVKEKIDEIAEWSVVDVVNKKHKNKKKLCWIVAADVLDKYGLGNLSLKNEWSYKLQPRFDRDKCDSDQNAAIIENESENTKADKAADKNQKKKTKHPGITKFTKVLKKQEQNNKIEVSPKNSKISTTLSSKTEETQKPTTAVEKPNETPAPAANKTPVVKKRVALLMSVPPGQQFSPQSKNAVISKFLEKNKKPVTPPTEATIKPSENEKTPKVPSSSSITAMDVDEIVVLD